MKPHIRHKFERFQKPLDDIERRCRLISKLESWAIINGHSKMVEHYRLLWKAHYGTCVYNLDNLKEGS